MAFRGRGRGYSYAAPRVPTTSRGPKAHKSQLIEPCMIYTRTGRCNQPGCRYQHKPGRVAICQQFIKTGRCTTQGTNRCTLSHTPQAENAPMCVHFARGNCTNEGCKFAHMTQLGANPESRPTCRTFALNGWCDRGLNCTRRHVFECPDFETYGKCFVNNCELQHVIKSEAIQEAQTNAAPTKSEMVNVSEFIQFLREATRESCNVEYSPNHNLEAASNASDEDPTSESEPEIDIDMAKVEESPLDAGADFIQI